MEERISDNSIESASLPPFKIVIRGIQAFILISLAGTLLAFWWKRPLGFGALLQQLRWIYLFILIPLVGVDYIIGGLRYRLLLNGKILTRISLWDCMRSNWANIFLGVVTPFQTGGGAAQVYILWRSGAKVSEGVLSSLINYSATMIFFLVASLMSLLFLPSHFLGNNYAPIIKAAYIVLFISFAVTLAILFFPRTAIIAIRGLFRIIPVRKEKFIRFKDRQINKMELGAGRFQKAFRRILRINKGLLVIIILFTIVLFMNKFIIGYFIAGLLGVKVPFAIFITLQIIQLFIIYYAPTPGASGVAELSSTWLIAYLLPAGLILIYTVIWRFLTTILGAIIGGFILFLDINFLKKERTTANRKEND